MLPLELPRKNILTILTKRKMRKTVKRMVKKNVPQSSRLYSIAYKDKDFSVQNHERSDSFFSAYIYLCHTNTPIANMAAPARKQGFSVVTVAKANSSLICFVEASAFAHCWLFMCSINSSELVRK